MLGVVSRKVSGSALRTSAVAKNIRFSSGGIPANTEQAWGREKFELEEQAAGRVAFNNDPIIPPTNAGTKENPIMVMSGLSVRAVGYEDPNTHQLNWFNLSRGPVHYIPSIGLHFKMQVVSNHY